MLQNPTPFDDQNTQQMSNRREFPQPNQRHLQKKLTANIIRNGERPNISLSDQQQHKKVHSLFLFNIVLKVLARAIRQGEKNKRLPD